MVQTGRREITPECALLQAGELRQADVRKPQGATEGGSHHPHPFDGNQCRERLAGNENGAVSRPTTYVYLVLPDHTHGNKTFAAAGPRLLNSLLVQTSLAYGLFRRQLKGHLFRKHEHGALWLLICVALLTYLLTYLLTSVQWYGICLIFIPNCNSE